ncbi:hypothetical protein DES53_10495 [Roseimicrobium gellanilyticum]|uniref:Uncharacterized protein n=1 Tax=Roseimicrobium gellanilyticum TaxID=748857 RepID=A0A366HNC1_9BACT|nr:hypothetical protein DES53_10495 [Roseimicrobium gellanilyticum]
MVTLACKVTHPEKLGDCVAVKRAAGCAQGKRQQGCAQSKVASPHKCPHGRGGEFIGRHQKKNGRSCDLPFVMTAGARRTTF